MKLLLPSGEENPPAFQVEAVLGMWRLTHQSQLADDSLCIHGTDSAQVAVAKPMNHLV